MKTLSDFHTHDPGTFRYKDIVYIRTDKCGGTFFQKLFETYGFKKIRQHEISDRDKLFTFIINPRSRRIKAVTQLIYNTQTIELLKDENFLRFIEHMIIGDYHAYPYFLQYGHLLDRTLFLPLDHHSIKPATLLEEYFKTHLPELAENDLTNQTLDSNKADSKKQQLYDLVSGVLNPSFFDIVMRQDFELYNDCVKGIDQNLREYLTSKYHK